jgi:putative tributyrin esterase
MPAVSATAARCRRPALAVLLLAALAGSAGSAGARAARLQLRADGAVSYGSLPSKALGGHLSFAVYTPPGYATSGRRYPVVYFLHGLPATAGTYRSTAAFVARHLGAIDAQAIAVVPQGARAGDADPEYFDWGPGRNWETAIATELPRYVDGRYRTIADRRGRAIVGLSAGGYGAAIIGLHHPQEYSVIESWSGYFVARDLEGDAALDLGSDSRNVRGSAYAVVSALHGVFGRLPTYLAFYVGRQDGLFYPDDHVYDEVLRLLDVPHTYAVYPGGHDWALWDAHAGPWLAAAVDHLARPT